MYNYGSGLLKSQEKVLARPQEKEKKSRWILAFRRNSRYKKCLNEMFYFENAPVHLFIRMCESFFFL